MSYPVQSAQTPHNHKCSLCATVWHHDPDAIPANQEAWDQAHACPQCGHREYFVNAPHATPQFCSNGARCVRLDGSGDVVSAHPPLPLTAEQRARREKQMAAQNAMHALFSLLEGLPKAA